jgi:hypothetical protein
MHLALSQCTTGVHDVRIKMAAAASLFNLNNVDDFLDKLPHTVNNSEPFKLPMVKG